MRDRLILCAACSRHAKAFEARCPFCGQDLVVEGGARPSASDPFRRMAAAAAVAAGVAALQACSASGSHTAFYGSPGIEPSGDDASGDTSDDASGGATGDSPGIGVFYGLANPMPVDSGPDGSDGAAPADASEGGGDDGSSDAIG
jgi:hypothetical protein